MLSARPTVRTSRAQSALLVLLLAALSGAACRSAVPVVPTPSSPIARQVIYVVHGDASYLYHDDEGTARQADEDAVAAAQRVAAGLADTEVFIFHQRAQRRLLGLFARSDGTWIHYRGERRIGEGRYRRTAEPLAAEAELLDRHGVRTAPTRTLLYYGHAIPEAGVQGYSRSHPDWAFSTSLFAEGLARLSPLPFDLVVLSTCANGTPGTLAALAPHAQVVVAAPADLHLSHLDSDALLTAPSDDPHAQAHALARTSFARLDTTTQTAVTIVAYDLTRLAPALAALQPTYADRLQEPTPPTAYRDCAVDSSFANRLPTEGVTVWHRPARFGRNKAPIHSGWACPVPAY